jgi:ribose transport system substrate-binding protein
MAKGLRVFFLMLLILCVAAFTGLAQDKGNGAKPTLCTVIRSVDHPYHIAWHDGGVGFAKMVGLQHADVNCGGNSQKQNDDIAALIAKTGGNIVFNIDPNESPDVVPIAKACEESKVYWVSWWNKPDDVNVMDYKYWVAHIAYDGVTDGYFTAKTLFDAIGGKGKVFEVQGMLANGANITRVQGFKKALAEYPGIKVVADLPGEWDQSKAYDLVANALVANPDVKGIWAAADNMCMGAIEALKQKGLDKKVPVTGMNGDEITIQAILDGTCIATAYFDPSWQGCFGLNMALAAKRGTLDVGSLPAAKRTWYAKSVQIDKKNAAAALKNYYKAAPPFEKAYGADMKDLWKRYLKGM